MFTYELSGYLTELRTAKGLAFQPKQNHFVGFVK